MRALRCRDSGSVRFPGANIMGAMTPFVVAVLGGYGVFGRRIAANLSRRSEIELVVAGRDPAAAAALARNLGTGKARPLAIDAMAPAGIERLMAERPAVVVDTIGPFQSRDHRLARDCIAAGVHYLDIADSRDRVCAISDLDHAARAAGASVISGASTVPAITTAIVDDLVPDRRSVTAIDVGISPGHRAPRGLATVRAILGYCGKAIPAIPPAAREYGWGDLQRYRYPSPAGARWLSNVDTPERALWLLRYPSLQRVSIKAGLEIGWMHLALSGWSRGVRVRLLPSPAAFAPAALRVAALLDRFGTDAGAMHVRVTAGAGAGEDIVRTGTIVAAAGDGPQIPAAPAAIVVKRLLGLSGYRLLATRGATPCIGLLTLAEIMAELDGFAIRYFAGGT